LGREQAKRHKLVEKRRKKETRIRRKELRYLDIINLKICRKIETICKKIREVF
jgi:hypothetical protein